MSDLLRKVPQDIFLLILEELPKTDLKSLSQVSTWLHESVASTLWKSITIQSRSEYKLHDLPTNGLPYRHLKLARQLHFRAPLKKLADHRCPHFTDWVRSWDAKTDDDLDDQPQPELYFDVFSYGADSLVGRMEHDQLQSFSWDLGTCVPANILGPEGILSVQQPSLQTLSLITDPKCEYCLIMPFQYAPGVELSSFRRLLNFAWKGLRPEHMEPLGVVLRNNSRHLKSLELDFCNLIRFFRNNKDGQDKSSSTTSDNTSDNGDGMDRTGVRKSRFFASNILGVDSKSPSLLFPNIRVLSLSHVPLTRSMAPVFSFDTLVSLRLRLCSCWDVFIKRVLKLNHPIRLKMLEIQDSDAVSDDLGEDIILDFVNAFEGLEELFVCHPGPMSALELWKVVAHRHTTLKALVCHQTTVVQDWSSPVFGQVCDLADMGIDGGEMRRIREDPSKNPLTELDLEFIGLACIPGRMKYLMLPFTSKTSLKAIHIRQTRSDIQKFGSWALRDRISPLISRARSDASSDSDLTTHTEIASFEFDDDELAPPGTYLRNEFRHFAQWAFGPEGISSLDIIAYGDFAHGGRLSSDSVLLKRQTGRTSHFRVLAAMGWEWKDALDQYHVEMGACPSEQLFRS